MKLRNRFAMGYFAVHGICVLLIAVLHGSGARGYGDKMLIGLLFSYTPAQSLLLPLIYSEKPSDLLLKTVIFGGLYFAALGWLTGVVIDFKRRWIAEHASPT